MKQKNIENKIIIEMSELAIRELAKFFRNFSINDKDEIIGRSFTISVNDIDSFEIVVTENPKHFKIL